MTNNKIHRGFTLIETLIAVSVLMVAIAGPLTIAAKGMQTTLIAKDQNTAFFLAQDAVEYVRWVRDTNKLSGGNWLTGSGGTAGNIKDLTPCVSSNGSAACRVDSIQNIVTTCSNDPGGVCMPIQYDSTNNYFSYTSGSATLFTRTISITTPVGSNADEAQIQVTVSWCDQVSVCAVRPRPVTVLENIFNWQ